MRLLSLYLLLGLTACVSPDAPDDPAPGPTVVIDSLVTNDPAIHYTIAIGYPQIEGLETEAVSRVNQAIRDTLVDFTMAIRPDRSDFTGDPEQDRLIVANAQGGPVRVVLNDSLFSARVDVYLYTGGAHGDTVTFPLTYDLTTGEPIRTPDLFRDAPAAWDTLAARSTRQLTARLGGGALFDDAVPAEPSLFSNVTLGNDSLTVFFPPYAVGPYAIGAQEVTWSYAALRDVLAPAGPLGAFAER